MLLLSLSNSTMIEKGKISVDPYSNFIFYKVTKPEKIQEQIPEKLNYIKVSIFGEEPEYYLLFLIYRQQNNKYSIYNFEIASFVYDTINDNTGLYIFEQFSSTNNNNTEIQIEKNIDSTIMAKVSEETVLYSVSISIKKRSLNTLNKKLFLNSFTNSYYENNYINKTCTEYQLDKAYITNDLIIRNDLWNSFRESDPLFGLVFPITLKFKLDN